MNKYILLALIFCFSNVFGSFQASKSYSHDLEGFDRSSLIFLNYIKVGSEIGKGYRVHKKLHGAEISLNEAIVLHHSWFNVKAKYLLYPYYKTRNFLYFGCGIGLNHERDFHDRQAKFLTKISNQNCRNCKCNMTYGSFEMLMGREFLFKKEVKTFIQFGCSIPLETKASLPFLPYLSLGYFY